MLFISDYALEFLAKVFVEMIGSLKSGNFASFVSIFVSKNATLCVFLTEEKHKN